MALFNYANREITAKVVYYGPGVCGKTTSLQYIHERISPSQRGRLLSLATETDRTIFFDLLPLKLGEIGGFKLRFQLYTVPGQVKYNKTRKLVLQGADAVVFVADSQTTRREANIESFKNLQENLSEQNRRLEDVPLVYAYNKRDLENPIPVEDLNKDLNAKSLPYFPTIAIKGVGIMETLETISKLALEDMEQRLTSKSVPETKEAEEEFDENLMMEEDELIDLTGGEEEGLTFSPEELGSLQLESDLSESDLEEGLGSPLESKPIGYDSNVTIEEIEIRDEDVAHTGTLQESEFFNLQEIEEQALRELDDFLEGKLDEDESLMAFTAPGPQEEIPSGEESEEDFAGLSLDEEPQTTEEKPELVFDLEEKSEEKLLSFDSETPGIEAEGIEEGEEALAFDSEAPGIEAEGIEEGEEALAFDLEAPGIEAEGIEEGEEAITFDLEAPGIEAEGIEGGEEALAFDLEAPGIEAEGIEAGIEEEPLSFDLETPEVETEEPLLGLEEEAPSLSTEEDELIAFNLEEEGEAQPGPLETSAKGEIESLDISDSDLDLNFDEQTIESSEELPSFISDEEPVPEEPSVSSAGEDELVAFNLDETVEEEMPKAEVESLDLSESDLGVSFDVEEAKPAETSTDDLDSDTQDFSESSFDDFRITDSVRFEMQYGEDISSVTSFEQQLDELSGEMFTHEEEVSKDEFQPEVSETTEEEAFQDISDEWTRLIVVAKHCYHRAESLRAEHTTSDNILAIMMYYTAIEIAVKAVASKYESCNPEIASFKLMLESIEEETGKTVAGTKSLMNNIVSLRNKIQLESLYPDDEECELAARISERFLTSLAQEFLTIDFSSLSPVLARPAEK